MPGKYIVKILFGWNDKKFEDEYLKKELAKIEVSFSRERTLKGGDVRVVNNGLGFISFFFSFRFLHFILNFFSLFKHR